MTSLKVPGELRGTARSERNEGARREKGESLPLGSDRRSRNELRPTSRPDTATGLDVPLITGEEKGRRRIYIQYRERNYVARGQLGQPQLEVNGRTCVANPVVAPRTPSNFFLFLFFSFSLLRHSSQFPFPCIYQCGSPTSRTEASPTVSRVSLFQIGYFDGCLLRKPHSLLFGTQTIP